MTSMDDPSKRTLAQELAKRVLELRADEMMQQRVNALADKCNEGTLTADERAEYQEVVSFFNLLTTLQAKARTFLQLDQ
jgi:hypothetical protein